MAKVLEQRGEHPGLVHVISAMEACDAYKPWHDKQTHKTYVRPDSGKCLHYYFYFMDAAGAGLPAGPDVGTVPSAIRLNAHSRLARTDGEGHCVHGRQRVRPHRRLATCSGTGGGLSPDELHRVLDRYATLCCPVLDVFGQTYHWSLMQVEYATDLVFRSAATLRPLYEQLVRESVLNVKASRSPPSSAERSHRNWAGDRLPVLHPDRGDLHQAPLQQVLDQKLTSMASCCGSRRRPTTCRSSSTTARWNIAQAPRHGIRSGQEVNLQPDRPA